MSRSPCFRREQREVLQLYQVLARLRSTTKLGPAQADCDARARSGYAWWDGCGTPRVDAGHMDSRRGSSKRSCNAQMFVPGCVQTSGHGFDAAWTHHRNAPDTPRSQDGRMVSTRLPRTIAGQTVPRGTVRPDSQDGTVPRWCPRACQERSRSVPKGGKTGGHQSSAPQVHPRDSSDKLAAISRDGREHGFDTLWTHQGVGPTAHKDNQLVLVLLVLLVLLLLYCCSADLVWTVP
jgi:hypothetical protein